MTKRIEFSYFWTSIFIVVLFISFFALFSEPRDEPLLNLPDKVMHFFLFLTLSFLLNKSNDYLKTSLFFIISYAVLSEIIQSFLPNREGDFLDLFFNLLGILVIFWKKIFFFSRA